MEVASGRCHLGASRSAISGRTVAAGPLRSPVITVESSGLIKVALTRAFTVERVTRIELA
jgi:hypothetical protein